MVTPRITTTAIGGLVTTPNQYGVMPEGTCSTLLNVRFTGPNKCSGVRLPVTDNQGGISGGEVIRIAPLTSGKYCSIQMSGTTFAHYGENTTANLYTLPSYISSTNLYTSDGYLSPIISRSRFFTNTRQGVLALDTTNPSSGSDRTLRSTALPQPQISSITLTAGATLPAAIDTIVSIAAVFVRESTDYVLTSPSSITFRILNESLAAKDPVVTVKWAYSDDIKAGDYIELYMSNGVQASSYAAADTGTDCFLVTRYQVNSTDATNKFASITIRSPLTASPELAVQGGALIYTAGTQAGAAGANNEPPICRVMAQWSNYVFYGNVTEDPTFIFDVPAGWGPLGTAYLRQYGIGFRDGLGTVTIGSPTVTGVSAADMVGVQVGQYYDTSSGGTEFSATARIISKTATTFTFNQNALGSGGAWRLQDCVQINGVDYMAGDLGLFARELGASGLFEMQAGATLPGSLSSAFGTLTYGDTLTIDPIHHTSSFTIRATNGANYSQPVPEYTATALTVSQTEHKNMLRYSKYNQPEAVPYVQELRIGLGEIIAITPTTDAIWVACTDGIFKVSGADQQWQSTPIDSQLVVVGPQAVQPLFDNVYAYSNRGLVRYGNAGVELISKAVIESLIPGAAYQASRFPILMADETREEITLLFKTTSTTATATVYLYSAVYGKFSQLFSFNPDDRITALAMRRDTAVAGERPYPLLGLFVSAAAPKVLKDDGTGNVGLVSVQLNTLGDPTTVKAWIDLQWIFNLGAANTFTVNGVINGVPHGSGKAKPTKVDARAGLGIPKSASTRASIAPGFTISSQTIGFDLLGCSPRVVPQTTDQETR